MEVTHVCVLLLMFWSGIGDAHVISNGFEGCSEHSNHNVSCGSVLNGIKGYFVNPDYPNDNADPGNCNIRINITRNDICQVRLDFLDFEMAQPDVDGKCKDDFFMGFNEAGTMPVLCGSIKEQHMYWDVVTKPSMVNLSIYRSPFRNGQRRWNIQIEQIPCCSRGTVGNHILQLLCSH
ncbi:hypothetical protein SK128_005692 [Halocaridina rubra]|uniref:CUB domain-containing protein n=1 Tax=Halocaridina rubra TaxID=373956 RepID=A0AAN9A308_HALRR